MSSGLKDKNQATIVKPSIDLSIQVDNVKPLKSNVSIDHLEMLDHDLNLLIILIEEQISDDIPQSQELRSYIKDLKTCLDAYILKSRIEILEPIHNISLSFCIDPSDSGFPIFFRDFRFLTNDKIKVEKEQVQFRDTGQLVDDALFSIFRGIYPEDIILEKLRQEYHEKLLNINLPQELEIESNKKLKEENTYAFCKKTVRRYNGDDNLPQFYVLYFTLPKLTYT